MSQLVLDALSSWGQELVKDAKFIWDGIGYFPSLPRQTTEPQRQTQKRKSDQSEASVIQFRADQTLKNEFGVLKVKKPQSGRFPPKLTNEEIDSITDSVPVPSIYAKT